MENKTINLKYPSLERLGNDCPQLREGRLFLLTNNPLPVGTHITVKFVLPGLQQDLIAEAMVVKQDQQPASPGMLLGFLQNSVQTLAQLIGIHEEYLASAAADRQEPVHHAPAASGAAKPDLNMEWLKKAVSREEIAQPAKEVEAPPLPPPGRVKKELTVDEQAKAKPAAQFLIDLTRAMLRSGYYDPDHPASKQAKQGLYAEFRHVLGNNVDELMFTKEGRDSSSDISITGIIDEPVSVRKIVGEGQSELFLPKLHEYFEQKGLVSFTIKKIITQPHFDCFVDIMNTPGMEQGGDAQLGETLTRALVDRGITEISTVFKDDMLTLEESLPWRVQMAIHRLFKDLKVLPLFKGKSAEEIKAMKVQIIQDILRPLKHPNLLKDMVVNCYVIAANIGTLDAEDLERTIISSFPLGLLLSTSRLILEELQLLSGKRKKYHDNPEALRLLERRLASIRRILKVLSLRLAHEQPAGAQHFLEEIFHHSILRYQELPEAVRYRIDTGRMADDIGKNSDSYAQMLVASESADDAATLVQCFHRTATTLFEKQDWQALLAMARAVTEVALRYPRLPGIAPLPDPPVLYLFAEIIEALPAAYEATPPAQRGIINQILNLLGEPGIDLLLKILEQCEAKEIRRDAVEALIHAGGRARTRALMILDDQKQPWFMSRNALLLLSHLGKRDEDIGRVRKFLRHSHPKLREEALIAAVKLQARDIEPLLLTAVKDKEERVRKKAIVLLGQIAPLSEATIARLLEMIKTPAEPDENSAEQEQLKARLIRVLGAMASLPHPEQIEESILEVARQITEEKKGFFDFFKLTPHQEQPVVLSAALEALARIGGPQSEQFLRELAASASIHAEPARKALTQMQHRQEPTPP